MNTNKCPPDTRSNNGIYSCLKISPNGNKCTRLEGHMDEHHAHGVGNRCIEVWTDEDKMNVTGVTKVNTEQLIDKLEVDIFDLIDKFEKEVPDGTYVTDISINRKDGDIESIDIDTIKS